MSMRRDAIKPGREYVNLKTRQTYVLLSVTRDSETQEERAVYEESPPQFKKDLPWDRPMSLFLEKFEELERPCFDCGRSGQAHRDYLAQYGRCYWGG
jgi:hypothetical protein